MSKKNLSTQQKRILLALSCLTEEYSKYLDKKSNPIHSIINLIEPQKIKKHYYLERDHIDKTRYASYHRSLKDLYEKDLISKIRLTSKKKKGWIFYKLTKEGKETIDRIVSSILKVYNKLEPFLQLINKISWRYDTSFDKVYILYGMRRVKDYGEVDVVLGIFGIFKKAIKHIENIEANKENYHCRKCDYESDNKEGYDNIELTDTLFKDKQCPNCNNKMSLFHHYNSLIISEWRLNGDQSFSGSYYDCEYDFDKEMVKERFNLDSVHTYREANTKIL